jgi:hypothetical protein
VITGEFCTKFQPGERMYLSHASLRGCKIEYRESNNKTHQKKQKTALQAVFDPQVLSGLFKKGNIR